MAPGPSGERWSGEGPRGTRLRQHHDSPLHHIRERVEPPNTSQSRLCRVLILSATRAFSELSLQTSSFSSGTECHFP